MKALKYVFKTCLLLVGLFLLCSSRSANPISPDGTYKGRKLMGRVMWVEHAPTFWVSVARHPLTADLRVRVLVHHKPQQIGDWQVIPAGKPDFTVGFVDGGADFSIYVVDRDPGVN